jgi:hypothetical protein
MSSPPPKHIPTFYALIIGQAFGLLIVLLGMLPYWFGPGKADAQSIIDWHNVKDTISWRVASVCFVLLLSVIVPIWKNTVPTIIAQMAGRVVPNPSPWATNPKMVRNLLWFYLYLDLILLSYLVHITGGITGSMYAGIYLMLPSVSILLGFEEQDVFRAKLFAAFCCMGIFFSFLMSHFREFEFDAAKYEHAFDIALGLVTFSSIALPLFEIALVEAEWKKPGNDVFDKPKHEQKKSSKRLVLKRRYIVSALFAATFTASITILVYKVFAPRDVSYLPLSSDITIWIALFTAIVSAVGTISTIIIASRKDRREARETELRITQLERELAASSEKPSLPISEGNRK